MSFLRLNVQNCFYFIHELMPYLFCSSKSFIIFILNFNFIICIAIYFSIKFDVCLVTAVAAMYRDKNRLTKLFSYTYLQVGCREFVLTFSSG